MTALLAAITFFYDAYIVDAVFGWLILQTFGTFALNAVPFLTEAVYLMYEWPINYTKRLIEYWNLTISSLLIVVDLVVTLYFDEVRPYFEPFYFLLVAV